jgi:hypothetical protein
MLDFNRCSCLRINGGLDFTLIVVGRTSDCCDILETTLDDIVRTRGVVPAGEYVARKCSEERAVHGTICVAGPGRIRWKVWSKIAGVSLEMSFRALPIVRCYPVVFLTYDVRFPGRKINFAILGDVEPQVRPYPRWHNFVAIEIHPEQGRRRYPRPVDGLCVRGSQRKRRAKSVIETHERRECLIQTQKSVHRLTRTHNRGRSLQVGRSEALRQKKLLLRRSGSFPSCENTGLQRDDAERSYQRCSRGPEDHPVTASY